MRKGLYFESHRRFVVGEDGDVVTYIIAHNTPNSLDSARIRMHIKLPLSDIYSGRWQIIRRIGGNVLLLNIVLGDVWKLFTQALKLFGSKQVLVMRIWKNS